MGNILSNYFGDSVVMLGIELGTPTLLVLLFVLLRFVWLLRRPRLSYVYKKAQKKGEGPTLRLQ